MDVDLYHPVKHCLECIDDRLAPHAVVIIDDCKYQALPGAERAVEEFLADKPEVAHSFFMPNAFHHPHHAFFRKAARLNGHVARDQQFAPPEEQLVAT